MGGESPGGWQKATWGDLIELAYGRALREPKLEAGPVAVWGTNGPTGAFVTAPQEEGPTIVIGRKGAYRGVRLTRDPFWVIDTAFFARPLVDLDMVWAYAVLSLRDINALDSGSAIPSTRREDVYALSVSVPPVPEQRAIASVLGALDDKIESNRRLVVAQRQIRSLQFANLCRIRFHRVPLGAIAEHVKGTIQPAATPDEDFEQFSIPAFDATGDPEVCLGRTMASGKTPLPSEPVVLISKLNPRIPRVWAPVPSGVGRAVCSPEFLVLRPKPDISHAWLDACVRHDERFYDDLLAGVTGTTGSRQRVKPADVMAATVLDPTAEEIAEWTAFAGPMIGREAALDRERRTLTAIRDSLLPKLVSGQLRVPLSDDPEEQVGAALEARGA